MFWLYMTQLLHYIFAFNLLKRDIGRKNASITEHTNLHKLLKNDKDFLFSLRNSFVVVDLTRTKHKGNSI